MRKNKSKTILGLPLLIIIAIIYFFNADYSEKTDNIYIEDIASETNSCDTENIIPGTDNQAENKEKKACKELQVHFIDVGQGDATLLMCDGEAMLIDAGNNNKGTAVQLYLKKQGIEQLKYIVGTHPDADHIGGLDVIITKFDIFSGQVWMPDCDSDTNTYRDVLMAIEYKGLIKKCPKREDTYSLGTAIISICSSTEIYSDSNDNSIVIRVENGDNSFIFTGDATEKEERDIIKQIDVAADVLKVGHHGSKTSTSDEFLWAVNPSYAVISVGDNSYGHPTAECLNKLRDYGVKLFRTDEQGSIIAVSDGVEIKWNCSSTDSWQSNDK